MNTGRALLILVLSFLVTAGSVRADAIFGEFERQPNQIERGFSLGFDFGMLLFTGEKRSAKNPGFSLSLTTGYDIWKYITIEGISTIGITEADPVDPQLQGGINTFLFNGAAKLQYPLGRVYPFVEIGPGVHYSDPGFAPDQNWKFCMLMAGGVEYYTYLRHFSLFAKASYIYTTQKSQPISAALAPTTLGLLGASMGLRYTF